MRMEGLAVAHETIDRFEADLLVAALRAEGIPASINEDSRRSMLGGGLLGPGTHGADPLVEILVPAERLDEAAEVLAQSGQVADLPPEFHDDEDWADRVHTGTNRRRRMRRRLVLGWIYLMAGSLVLVALIASLSTRGT